MTDQSPAQSERESWWWMLRYPTGAVRMATEQGDESGTLREEEAREVGARLFRVVREQDYADAVEALRELWGDIREVDKMFVPNDVVAKVKAVLGG